MRARLLSLAAASALVLAPAAAANGDPASQALPTSDLYVSPRVGDAPRADLEELTRRARDGGHPVKVVIITQPLELGNLIDLYRAPDRYALHLGTELKFFSDFDGTLLVAMPTGFGIYGSEARRVREPADAVADPDTLARSAAQAIRPLAGGPSGEGGLGGGVIAALVAGALALAVLVSLLALRAQVVKPRRASSSADDSNLRSPRNGEGA